MKRTFDLLVSMLLLIILSPLLFIVAIAVYFSVGFPVFFVQSRVGKHEKIINLIKFRSMTNERDTFGNLLPNAERVTSLGSMIRKTSIDELPSLLNVIRGELSLVGPRPLLPHYLKHYKQVHKRRHDVRPGITGLAQINGRNCTTWNERLDFDVEYVDNQSFLLDLRIMFLTIMTVLKKESVEGSVDLSIVPLDKDEEYLCKKKK